MSMVKGRFGSFSGVFVPTFLTILGIILFLRLGWVVGQAGLIYALVIIFLANVITLITGLSLSTIATSMLVRTGGAYYMISRTLGLEIGGAIGIPLYLSQAISVAFYIIGFTEAFTTTFPGFEPQLLSSVLALLFGFLAFLGAHFVIRIQYIILVILVSALVSFFVGSGGEFISPAYWPSPNATVTFWQVFAIFFPAVTGIMVGVSMSGDLEEPEKNIPQGTLLAIVTTCAIYLSAAIWLAVHSTPAELTSNYMIMQKIAAWPLLIMLGIWASTLSSALGSVLAAPRTLEAISRDRAAPHWLSARLGSPTEPRMGVLITTAIALAIIWLGDLDFVAPIITMFFLNTYGMINLTAGLEQLIGNPSFRPRIMIPWYVSLIGALGCYGAMFLISPKATIIAIIISFSIFVLLERRSLKQEWGDLRPGFWFALVRFGLIRLESQRWHIKNWRPNIIIFTGLIDSYEELLEVGAWLSSGRGIITFFHLLVGNFEELVGRGLRNTSAKHTQKYLVQQGITAFAECSIVSEFYQGVLNIVQAHGIAGLEPNTVLMGWSADLEGKTKQLLLMHQLVALKKSVLFLHHNKEFGFGSKSQIDIWWRGRDRNAELMLLLAHIIKQSRSWEGATIRVLRLLPREEGRLGAEEHLMALLGQIRVQADPVVLINQDSAEDFSKVVREFSSAADLVFFGLNLPETDEIAATVRKIDPMLQNLPSTILVRSAELEDVLESSS